MTNNVHPILNGTLGVMSGDTVAKAKTVTYDCVVCWQCQGTGWVTVYGSGDAEHTSRCTNCGGKCEVVVERQAP